MIVQRFGNLFARRQIGALGKRPSGCEQCDKRPEDDRRSHAILPRADTGTTCQRTGSDRFDWVTASTSIPRASSSTISSSALRRRRPDPRSAVLALPHFQPPTPCPASPTSVVSGTDGA